jgi:hypothetical protein
MEKIQKKNEKSLEENIMFQEINQVLLEQITLTKKKAN